MQNIKIITDVDGVLLDSVIFRERNSYHKLWRDDPPKLSSFNKLMASKDGYKLNRYGRFRHVLSETENNFFASLKDEELKEDYTIKRYANEYSKITRDGVIKIGLFPKVIKALSLFTENKFSLFAASGSDQNDLVYIFHALRISEYFKKIYGFSINSGSSFKKCKLFNKLMVTEKDENPSNYIYIGDTERDLIDAKKMGFKFIGIANSKNGWATNETMKKESVLTFYEAAIKISKGIKNN